MRSATLLHGFLFMLVTTTCAADAPSISIVDSDTMTEELPAKPGVYVGQKITFSDTHDHDGETVARVGLWEADVSKTRLIDYPFTEYVLMISGRLVITNEDGTSEEFTSGDTFVMPKGWTGIWDIQERMKKQMVQIGDPNAKPKGEPVE